MIPTSGVTELAEARSCPAIFAEKTEMVMPIHNTDETEWPKWPYFLFGTCTVSVVFAVIWFLITRDRAETLFAAAIPWMFVVGCLLISLCWSITMIPLLIFVAKTLGDGKKTYRSRGKQGVPPNTHSPSAPVVGGR